MDMWYVKGDMGIRSSGYANTEGDEAGNYDFGEWKQKANERGNEWVGCLCLFILPSCLSMLSATQRERRALGGSIGKGGQRNRGWEREREMKGVKCEWGSFRRTAPMQGSRLAGEWDGWWMDGLHKPPPPTRFVRRRKLETDHWNRTIGTGPMCVHGFMDISSA